MDGDPLSSSEADAELERRLAAEREFHNRKFGEAQENGPPDSIYELPRAAYRAFEGELQSRAAGAEILEYGCGDCSYLAQLIEWGGRVTAIDISDEAIAAARELAQEGGLADRASFARMNAEELTFPDNTFDLIVGRAIL